jgi:hypothetical protein
MEGASFQGQVTGREIKMSKFKSGKDNIHYARITIEVEDFSNIDKIYQFLHDKKIETLVADGVEIRTLEDHEEHDYWPLDNDKPDDCEQCDEEGN